MSVASTSTPASKSDSWGGPATTVSRSGFSNALPTTVRDDWDDDDDEDPQADAEDSQRLWEEANKRAPMPEVVIASSSTSAAALSPPPAALQPALRILKRPSATTSASSSTISSFSSGASSSGPGGQLTGASNSYAEREAAYHAARERIFGDGGAARNVPTIPGARPQSSLVAGAKGSRAVAPAAAVPIAREPKGPPTPGTAGQKSPDGRGQGGEASGFANRRGRRRSGGKP